jgi:hypothetical protein
VCVGGGGRPPPPQPTARRGARPCLRRLPPASPLAHRDTLCDGGAILSSRLDASTGVQHAGTDVLNRPLLQSSRERAVQILLRNKFIAEQRHGIHAQPTLVPQTQDANFMQCRKEGRRGSSRAVFSHGTIYVIKVLTAQANQATQAYVSNAFPISDTNPPRISIKSQNAEPTLQCVRLKGSITGASPLTTTPCAQGRKGIQVTCHQRHFERRFAASLVTPGDW